MSYNASIPTPIRRNPDLPPRAKILYAEITANLDDTGLCTINNVKFASWLSCTKATISASLRELRENGYISVVIIRDEETQKFVKRYIMPSPPSNFLDGVDPEIKKAMSSFFDGGKDNSNDATESDSEKATSNKSNSIITSNNIRYISSSLKKKTSIIYNRGITESQMKFLKQIVADFYNEKHKQFPNNIAKDWYNDVNTTTGSVNTLHDLIIIDGWDERDVRDVIRWATNDKFWMRNLLSLRTLRDKSNNEQTKFANLHIKFTS